VSKDEPIADATLRYDLLVEQLRQWPVQPEVAFDDGATRVRKKLEQKHLDLTSLEAMNKKLAAHIGKYDGVFARLCLLWHCIENAGTYIPELVSEKTAERVAGFLHGFLLPHAAAFYVNVLGFSDDHDRLAAVAGYILAHELDVITNRDVQRGDRTMRGLKSRDVEDVFSQLDALGWVDRLPPLRAGAPPRWRVNPEVHQRFRERAEGERERRRREREMIAAALAGGEKP
jgi:hypothetical protein